MTAARVQRLRDARGWLLVGALAGLAGSSTAADAATTASIEIVNRTRWAIYELYLSPSAAEEWGDDQLGDETIEPGDHFFLSGIPCELWDVLLIDEDGDECVVAEVDLCRDDYKWVIENEALLACQGN